jgi:hypothetical protein
MPNLALRSLVAALVLSSAVPAAFADTNYDPYFSSINRCVGGYLVQAGMTCIYAFAACEGARSQMPEVRNVHMALTCRINADGTCPAAYECARDHSFAQASGVYDPNPRSCSQGTRNVECRWGHLLQR